MFEGYGVARKPLHQAQHGKCAYCEMQQQSAALPVEHFRPKARVTSDSEHVTSATGYWWLAWSWNNLLFSCTTCNSQARKGNHFALAPPSVPLRPEQEPPGEEWPMFIDPGCEDPIDHIVFVEIKRGHWVPRPRSGSARGRYTIDKLGLDNPALIDHYRDHVDHLVQPMLQEIRAALKREDAREVATRWRFCVRRLFHPRTPFQALSYDVLHASLSAKAREDWRLAIPRP